MYSAALQPTQACGRHRGFHRKRHKVENFLQRTKQFRRIGTRYEKRDLFFLGFFRLAAVLNWPK